MAKVNIDVIEGKYNIIGEKENDYQFKRKWSDLFWETTIILPR
jgi:hypothetical protein